MTGTDFFEVIATRGMVRKFTDQPIPFDIITEILFAGSRGATTGDTQLMKFVNEVDPDLIKNLYQPCLEHEAILTAQLSIVIVAETDLAEKHFGLRGQRLYVTQDCAAAAQNILLAAHALGLGASWIHSFDEAAVADILSVPTGARPQIILMLGYPAEEPEHPPLKDFRYLCNWTSYGGKYKDPHLVIYDFAVQWEKFAKQTKAYGKRKYRDVKERIDEKRGVKDVPEGERKDVRESIKDAQESAAKAMKDFMASLKKPKAKKKVSSSKTPLKARKKTVKKKAKKKSFLSSLKKPKRRR